MLFWSDTMGIPWPAVAEAAIEKCKRTGAGLLVVDTLGQFAGLLGDKENNAGDALEALRPLQRAANVGIAVVIVRHERKGGGAVEDFRAAADRHSQGRWTLLFYSVDLTETRRGISVCFTWCPVSTIRTNY